MPRYSGQFFRFHLGLVTPKAWQAKEFILPQLKIYFLIHVYYGQVRETFIFNFVRMEIWQMQASLYTLMNQG